MTIAVAVRRGDVTWIGADTRETAGNSYRTAPKITPFNNVFIAVAGWAETQFLLEEMVTEPESKLFEFNTIGDVRTFARALFKRLKEFIDASPKDDEDSSADELLIVTPTTIFTVDRFLYAIEYKKFAAIGSGSHYGTAALDIYYNEIDLTEEEVVRKSLELTCRYVVNCGKPLTIIQVGGK